MRMAPADAKLLRHLKPRRQLWRTPAL